MWFFSTYYEMAAKKFNDKGWIPHCIALPDLHPDFTLSKKLYLNVSPITGKELQDKLTSAWYKMVRVMNEWERSGAGRGMAVEDLEGEGVYKFLICFSSNCFALLLIMVFSLFLLLILPVITSHGLTFTTEVNNYFLFLFLWIYAFSLQYFVSFSCSLTCLSQFFQSLAKTAPKVIWCQKCPCLSYV